LFFVPGNLNDAWSNYKMRDAGFVVLIALMRGGLLCACLRGGSRLRGAGFKQSTGYADV